MSDQSATPDQGAEQQAAPEQAPAEQQQQAPPEWLGPIEERMNELRDQNYAIAEQFQSLAQPVEDDDDEQYDLYDEDGDLTPEAAQAIIDERVQQALHSTLSERDAQNAIVDRDEQFELLVEEIPALADPKVSKPLIDELVADLHDAGFEALIDHPRFVDLIEQRYKAQQFDERAASERPRKRGVILESGSGAAPQDRDDEPDWGDRIVKAAERLSPKI